MRSNAIELPLTNKPWKIARIDDLIVLVNEEHHPYIVRLIPNNAIDLFLFPLHGSMSATKAWEIGD